MIDPIGEQIAAQSAKSAGAVVDKLLGPTAEIMGVELADWYARRRNVQKVVEKAADRVDLSGPGIVPARVAAEVFEKAQWADDEFVAEYLSGVLASSRSPEGKNDAGVSWTALVGRLSSDQLALHWAFYSAFQRRSRSVSPGKFWSLTRERVILDFLPFSEELGWEMDETADSTRLLEAAYGLEREGLISDLTHGDGAYFADEEWAAKAGIRPDAQIVVFRATSHGVALLLHSVGRGDLWFGDVSCEAASTAIDDSPSLPKHSPVRFASDMGTSSD